MGLSRRDILQILKDENELLKARNRQIGKKLACLQQAFRVLSDMDRMARLPTGEIDVAGLFNQLLSLVLHACNSENGSLILLDEVAQELEFVEVIGSSRDALLNHRISVDTGIVGSSIKSGEAVLVESVHRTKAWSPEIDDFLDFHTESLMCVPLKIKGRVVGAIEVVNQVKDGAFDENDLNVLRAAGVYASRTLEQAEQSILSLGDK